MALLKINDAVRRTQESAVNAMTQCAKHKVADSYFKVGAEGLGTHDKGVVAQLLNNFSQITDSIAGPGNGNVGGTAATVYPPNGAQFTNMADFGPYIMEIWPLITAWYPEFPLKDLISVQSMDKPMAYLFYSTLATGTNKAATTVGDIVETPLGRRKIKGSYPTGEIKGELIPASQITTSGTILAYYPVATSMSTGYLPKTKVWVDGTTQYNFARLDGTDILFATDDGTEQAKTVICLNTISGKLDGTAITGAATKVVVNYAWDLDYATVDNIQRVKETVTMEALEAQPRAIALEWTIFSEYLKKSQFGVDIREDNTKRILNLLYQYQVRYILDELYDGAEGDFAGTHGSAVNITIPNFSAGQYFSMDTAISNVIRQLKQVATAIEMTNGRMEGNRIVASRNFKNWLESLPDTYFKSVAKDEKAWMGPREIGEFGQFKIYYDPEGFGTPDSATSNPAEKYPFYDPYAETPNQFGSNASEAGFMTYRGNEWYDAVYYLGEYMPLVPTDAVTLAVTTRTSFVSMEAYKYHKPTCVQRLNFIFA